MKKWLVLELEDNWQMILPDEDIKPHSKVIFDFNGKKEAPVCEDMSCPCNPKIDFINKLVIHNSFDNRE